MVERANATPPLERSVQLVYVTPLRAVSRDIEKALAAPIVELGLPLLVGSRTGDTGSSERLRQKSRLPDVLVTTPESLSLLLTQADARERFQRLVAVVVDEWHELAASKRGVQVELALARLRRFVPDLRTWALSATVARPDVAARAAVGLGVEPLIVQAEVDRPIHIESLLPERIERFPWSGHLGLAMLDPLLEWIDPSVSTLLFTNTRSQAERWFAEILRKRPEWAERLALHHGSIDREVREEIEARLKDGRLSLVVCTSSLDLGVDFAPVERVVQIGSPKGIARLIQRAGRSGHRPGAACSVLCVPTHAMELVEIAAARAAVRAGEIEERPSIDRPLDCLVQHMVTVALGGGFRPDDLFDEVRTTAAFAGLRREEFDWCRDLVVHGGGALRAYEQFRKVAIEDDGLHVVARKAVAQLHRMNVGTIAGDATLLVKFVQGRTLGTIEEDFIAKLRPGDSFLFAGRVLEFVRLREATAYVKPGRRHTPFTPHWAGARFPLSTALASSVRSVLDRAAEGIVTEPELVAALPVLRAQAERSRIPRFGEILIETTATREGFHLFVYPFEGRLVHEGLAALFALRLGRIAPTTFAMSMNDYGFELLTEKDVAYVDFIDDALCSRDRLFEDLFEGVNLGELGARQFRDIARVAGLVVQRVPGVERTGRQLQASASLLWQVLNEFDPENRLLEQARREVMHRHFEEGRLGRALDRLGTERRVVVATKGPSPMALPLIADRLGTTLSTESLADRLASFRAADAEATR
jgi:ATP-dependent Lhr-like helicase